MLPHSSVTLPELARFYPDPFAGFAVFDPQQIFGQRRAESLVDLTRCRNAETASLQRPPIDPLLYADVRARLELQVARPRIGAVIVIESPRDIDRMRVMSLDQIALIAIHLTYSIRQRLSQPRRQARLERCGPGY